MLRDAELIRQLDQDLAAKTIRLRLAGLRKLNDFRCNEVDRSVVQPPIGLQYIPGLLKRAPHDLGEFRLSGLIPCAVQN